MQRSNHVISGSTRPSPAGWLLTGIAWFAIWCGVKPGHDVGARVGFSVGWYETASMSGRTCASLYSASRVHSASANEVSSWCLCVRVLRYCEDRHRRNGRTEGNDRLRSPRRTASGSVYRWPARSIPAFRWNRLGPLAQAAREFIVVERSRQPTWPWRWSVRRSCSAASGQSGSHRCDNHQAAATGLSDRWWLQGRRIGSAVLFADLRRYATKGNADVAQR